MTFNYVLQNPHIEMTTVGQNNPVSEPYIIGSIRNTQLRREKPRSLVIFKSDDPEMVLALMKLLPKAGTWIDADKKPHNWNGVKELTAGETFGDEQYQAAIKLFAADENAWTDFSGFKYIMYKLPGKYVQRFSQDLGGHKKDEWVCEPNSNYVKVVTEIPLFVGVAQEGATQEQDQYIQGWTPADRLRSAMKRYVPLDKLIEHPDLLTVNGVQFAIKPSDMNNTGRTVDTGEEVV